MHIHYRIVIKILAMVTGITGIAMFPSLLCAFYYGEVSCISAFGSCAIVMAAIGFIAFKLINTRGSKLNIRDSFITVAMCWIVASLFGALPFIISGYVPNYASAFFEATAGFSTTGGTIMDTDAAPASLILWKATSHWLGGMGILIFAISVLPKLGVGGLSIAKAEAPGPKVEKMSNRISDSTKILYVTYILMTVAEFLLLLPSDMGVFDALVNTMGSISTGGLLAHSAGLAYYDSLYIELVVAAFTILSTVNFVLYYYLVSGKIKTILANMELRVYLCIILIASTLVTLSLWQSGTYDTIWEAARFGFSQTVGFVSTSGYSVANFTTWPEFCQLILFSLLFIGGCAASTCGSIKVIRVMVMFKMVLRGFTRRLHPRSVLAVKINNVPVSAPMASAITTFILLYFLVLIIAVLVLSTQGLDMETTIGAAVAALSNTGLAIGEIGISCDFSIFSVPLQLFLSILMIMGRLELFTIIIICMPGFWRHGK